MPYGFIKEGGKKNGRKNAQMLYMAHNNFGKIKIFKKGVQKMFGSNREILKLEAIKRDQQRQIEKLEDTKEQCVEELIRFTDNFIDNTIRKLYQIQDIQSLGISEQEKDIHRNVIINTSVTELLHYSDKIKELADLRKSN